MNAPVKIALYAILLIAAAYFGIQAKQSLPSATTNTRDAELEAASDIGGAYAPPEATVPISNPNPETPEPDTQPPSESPENTVTSGEAVDSQPAVSEQRGKLFRNGFFMALCIIGLGILAASDLSALIGQKAVDLLYNDDAPPLKSEMYEEGETLWTKGDYLGAIETFRLYYKKHPREIHALRRIAEIYEGDLKNYVAAAMEYEAILELPLPEHRWAWTALHLHNLYVKHLDRKDDAVELLKRVVTEHPGTAGGEKAAQRLRSLGYEIEIVDESLSPDDTDAETDSPLPKGFRPKG